MGFTYRLDALMRCYENELVPLREEVTRLNHELQRLEDKMAEIMQEIGSIAQYMHANLQQPELRRMGLAFIRERQEEHACIAAQHSEKQISLEAIQQQMKGVRTRIRQLEKHRERLREEHRHQEQKQLMHESDDMWLRFIRHRKQTYGY